MATALLVEDDLANLEALGEFVSRAGFEVSSASTLEKARRALGEQRFNILLTDLCLPDGSALELLPDLEQGGQQLDVVFVTGQASVDSAIEAFRGGAVDYLTKPIDLGRLRKILDNAKRTAELQDQVQNLRQELRELGRFGKMIGSSPQMQAVYDQIQRVAPTDASVFVIGPTGTGKELVAETVHALSRRASGAFVPVNCGAMSPNLIESELFGHERGSFTGAAKRHKGLFERAKGGTLFLDEITEMPLELQVKLLRALESRTIQRVGGDGLIETDVRVIAATNRDPQRAVADNVLREDLLYRLLVFPIQLPPLAQREGDVELIANHFLADLNRNAGTTKRLGESALDLLRRYPWPGNVRELRNVVERSYIMGADRIEAEAVPFHAELVTPPSSPPIQAAGTAAGLTVDELGIEVGMSIAEAERILLMATLDQFDGNKRKAAEQLGISLKTLYNRLNSYGTL
jgi:two-component system, NtrC family, response regulator AtoC